VHRTDSRFFSSPSDDDGSGEMPASTAAVVDAFETSEAAAAATPLLLFLFCGDGGCGELGRGASIAARTTSEGRPRRGRARAGRRATTPANCCLELKLGFFFSDAVVVVVAR
jgi:hypothetical protein